MLGEDEVVFSGKYKDFRLGVRYDVSQKDEKEVASILGHISSRIEPYAYSFSGIDTKAIEGFIRMDGKGIAAVADYLDNNSSEWNKWIKGTLKEPKLMPAANSYLFNRLLDKAGVSFKVNTPPTITPENEDTSDVIAFIAKYKDWVAIKKLGLEKVKDYEVSGILGGVNYTAVNKAFDFADMEKNDDRVQSVIKGKRKSLGNAVLCLKELEGSDPYVVCKVLEELGFRPYASSHMLVDAHPDVKPPKVRGRKPKG